MLFEEEPCLEILLRFQLQNQNCFQLQTFLLQEGTNFLFQIEMDEVIILCNVFPPSFVFEGKREGAAIHSIIVTRALVA